MIAKRLKLDSKRHRKFVAAHLCVVCNEGHISDAGPGTCQCAHVNYLGREHDGMRGKGTKARDIWTVPLCPTHHDRQGRHGQSGSPERSWWDDVAIDPEPICLELARRSPDPKVREAVETLAPHPVPAMGMGDSPGPSGAGD